MKINFYIAAQDFFQERLQNLLRPIEQGVVVKRHLFNAALFQELQFGDGTIERTRVKLRINLRHGAIGAAKRAAVGELKDSGLQARIKIPKRHGAVVGRHL